MASIEGRFVRYVIGYNHDGSPRCVPALVVRDWCDGLPAGEPRGLNLQVFFDGCNDANVHAYFRYPEGGGFERNAKGGDGWTYDNLDGVKPSKAECERGMGWRTSAAHSAEKKPGTWHWPDGMQPR